VSKNEPSLALQVQDRLVAGEVDVADVVGIQGDPARWRRGSEHAADLLQESIRIRVMRLADRVPASTDDDPIGPKAAAADTQARS
jgi:hypothetical protein